MAGLGANCEYDMKKIIWYAFFWVIPRRLEFICRRFGTLYLFHLHRQVDVSRILLTPTCLWRWNRQSVPKRRHINSRRRGITQKKAYQIIIQMVAACGIWCFGFQVVGMVWSWRLCVRFAGCCSKAPNTTGSDYLYNTLELLMMGIVLPETCWACNKICNKYNLLHLVGILFPRSNHVGEQLVTNKSLLLLLVGLTFIY